ncbi:MAG: hypothetical protein IPL28_16790 [Chloroflexi bacterium]|nr:hypothetical protein [Chloroflexota bacterium]
MKQASFNFILLLLGVVALVACGENPAPPTAVPPTAAVAPTATATQVVVPTETAVAVVVEETAVSTATMLVPAGTPKETYYAPFPLAITLDGDLSDWAGVPTVTMPELPTSSSVIIARDTEVSFAVAADANTLYFMADVTDPNIISGEHGADFWNEDSVEFYINAAGDLGLAQYVPGVAQITIPPVNIGRAPADYVFGGTQQDTTGVQAIVVATEKGYAVELSVPLQNEVWDIAPDPRQCHWLSVPPEWGGHGRPQPQTHLVSGRYG